MNKTSMTMSISMMVMLSIIMMMMIEKYLYQKNKKMSFECGFSMIMEKKMTFSINFLMMMMMFLIFDVEVSFLIPFVFMNKMTLTMSLMASSMFILILSILMLKEWKLGSLEWNK